MEGLANTIALRTSNGAALTLISTEVFVRLRRHFDRPARDTLRSLERNDISGYSVVSARYGESGTPGVYFTLTKQ